LGDRPYIGGQAVLEGVMMRSPKSFVVAVRRPDRSIAVREQAWVMVLPALKFLRWPLLRGAVVLGESLHNGFSALRFSAEQALPPESPNGEKGLPEGSSNLLLGLSTLLMVGLFIAAPHLLTYGLGRLFHPPLDPRGMVFHLVDGVFRIAILMGYLLAIARSDEAKRLFQYHGAEHKAIWTYESGKALTVENAKGFTTLHPRCGTSFLFIVVTVAVVLHALVLPFIPPLSSVPLVQQLWLILIKVPMAFPVAGLAYELQRLSAKPSCPRVLTWLMKPGMWMQYITTKEPDDAQLEIALLALGRALAREEGRVQVEEGVRVYPDLQAALA
jgi:uncharacterized protein YqhQ